MKSGEPPQYEFGWSDEHCCAWRKEVKGPKLRGPVEFSLKPQHSPEGDQDQPIKCVWKDDVEFEVTHITMVTHLNFWWSAVLKRRFMLVSEI